MRAIPLRVGITLLVVGIAALSLLLFVASGGVGSVDTDIAAESFESTSLSLAETDGQLLEYGRGLQQRIGEWAAQGAPDSFTDWLEDEVGDLQVDVLDEQGTLPELVVEPPIEFGVTHRCRSTSCETDGEPTDPTNWTLLAVEDRANLVSERSPTVVHGFSISDMAGDEILIRFEADVFSVANTQISSGLDDLVLIVFPVLLLAIAAATWFSLGRALRPVAAIIDQVDEIGADSLDQRVPVPAADDELQHLATTMNRMLDRLQQASETQRQFISDASHELRSPITATGATLEVARSNPEQADWENVAAVVKEENDRLAGLVDDLLLLARMDEDSTGIGIRREEVDLDEICLAEAARAHPVNISVNVLSPARVAGDSRTLTRALRNLLENATHHASSAVRVTVDVSGTEAQVLIEDDGPGVPPELADKVFERFFQIDESRNRENGAGAGLGLAIARRVAERHGGSVKLFPSELGGAAFLVQLPLTPAP